jgi:glucose-1-phosphatase
MIDLFVFDLGNVILPFDHRPIATKLHEHSAGNGVWTPKKIFDDLFDFANGIINRYEEGLSSSIEFYLELCNRYHLKLSYEEFREIWNNIFRDSPEVNELLVYLKAKGYPVFILSNTNELHFSHILERFPIIHIVDDWILSFEVGAKKPDRRIYDAIFEKRDVEKERVLFIDDMEQNVIAARSLGMQGLVFTNPKDLWEAVRKMNV